MNRCPDLVVCLKRDLQCLRPEASLVLIYRPNVAGMKGRVDLAHPVNRTPDLWCGSTKHYQSILFARSIWNVTDWQKVVFSDESRFAWGTHDNRVRVWRRPGPFLDGLPGAIFQQDNACPHTAKVSQDFLRHFHTLPWPVRSPDLSPVEHVWNQLKG
ncbi:transposable element Tcb2 transposase [Trichonephila clavipes]|nr:transposable element Tcb2 transposase [Trichonephila clavipes]